MAVKDLCCSRSRVVEGQPPKAYNKSSHKNGEVPIGTYVARGLGPSRASRQRLIISHLIKMGKYM